MPDQTSSDGQERRHNGYGIDLLSEAALQAHRHRPGWDNDEYCLESGEEQRAQTLAKRIMAYLNDEKVGTMHLYRARQHLGHVTLELEAPGPRAQGLLQRLRSQAPGSLNRHTASNAVMFGGFDKLSGACDSAMRWPANMSPKNSPLGR